MNAERKQRRRRDGEPNDDWGMVPVGAVFAVFGALGAAGRLDHADPSNWKDSAIAALFLLSGLGLLFFGVRGIVRRFRPPSRETRRRKERIGRIVGRLVVYAAGVAIAVGGLAAFVFFRLRALRPSGTVAERFEAFLWLPVAAFGIAILRHETPRPPFPPRARSSRVRPGHPSVGTRQ